jgi:hypothetical protein
MPQERPDPVKAALDKLPMFNRSASQRVDEWLGTSGIGLTLDRLPMFNTGDPELERERKREEAERMERQLELASTLDRGRERLTAPGGIDQRAGMPTDYPFVEPELELEQMPWPQMVPTVGGAQYRGTRIKATWPEQSRAKNIAGDIGLEVLRSIYGPSAFVAGMAKSYHDYRQAFTDEQVKMIEEQGVGAMVKWTWGEGARGAVEFQTKSLPKHLASTIGLRWPAGVGTRTNACIPAWRSSRISGRSSTCRQASQSACYRT